MLHTITNAEGRQFNVRVVRKGDGYGREDRVLHDRPTPLVEFYDASRAKPGERGQFVSRYYADTLFSREPGTGLTLDGGVPVWSLDGAALIDALAWVTTCLYGEGSKP